MFHEILYNVIVDKNETYRKTHFLINRASVSTESEIPDFGSKDELYCIKYDYQPEEILSHNLSNTS